MTPSRTTPLTRSDQLFGEIPRLRQKHGAAITRFFEIQ
jgi:hypothetical protein